MGMSKTVIAATFATVLMGTWPHPAAAMGPAAPVALSAASAPGAPVLAIHYAKRWHQRHYWRWDHRPIWDDPWQVLRPTIWGSAEPHYVPANIWARKWHPAHWHQWAHHHHW